MKCPKCGYNSFEYHDICKKCSNDLTAYKATYGLKSIVLPMEARASMAGEHATETPAAEHTPETTETAGDMFSFDTAEDHAAAPEATAVADNNPFNFDAEPEATEAQGFGEFSFDEPAAAQPQGFGEFPVDEGQKSAQTKAEEDAFASLLESTSQDDGAAEPAPAPEAASSGVVGEFDLEDFSWDDTPAAPAESGTKPDDDLNDLFGGTEDAAKK